MFGCYRKGEANDPDIYAAAISAVLADYDMEVIRAVTDPRKGLPRRIAWLPNVKEVGDACEEQKRWREAINFMAEKGYVWIDEKWQRAVDLEKATSK